MIPAFDQGVSMEELYSLNEVGSFIWKAMERPVTVGEITQLVANEFDQDTETVFSDVQEFLSSMEEIGAIREVSE